MAGESWNFSGVEQYSQQMDTPPDTPQTDTANTWSLGSTLAKLLPQGPVTDPMTDPTLGQPRGLIPQEQFTPRNGLPIAGGIIGSALGPAGTGFGAGMGSLAVSALGGMAGEAAGEVAGGESLQPGRILGAGAINAAGTMGGRVLAGAGRMVESGLRRMPMAQAAGLRGAYSTADAAESIPLTNLKGTVDDMLNRLHSVLGPDEAPATTGIRRLVKELEEIGGAVSMGERSMRDVSTIRELLGRFIQENKHLPQARALYGSLMSDLRMAAAGGSTNAGAYLRDLENDAIARGLMPEGWVERSILAGTAGVGAYTLNPMAAAPAALWLGGRALSRVPPSPIEPILSGAGQAYQSSRNPFRQ